MSAAEDFGHVPNPEFIDRRSREHVPCLCGADVTRAPFESVQTAVRRHNGTPTHRRWWDRVRVAWQGEADDAA